MYRSGELGQQDTNDRCDPKPVRVLQDRQVAALGSLPPAGCAPPCATARKTRTAPGQRDRERTERERARPSSLDQPESDRARPSIAHRAQAAPGNLILAWICARLWRQARLRDGGPGREDPSGIEGARSERAREGPRGLAQVCRGLVRIVSAGGCEGKSLK